ncbi:alcohol dehydrogenase [Sphingomonas sp. Leaf33]|uniref:zinc-dependent alcohol dehydrogenase family protein n=1 Tax=Sphingomonas sp. Leaf33 TaxID=1736215 RepID=UPI0006F4A3AF|nr:zinc-dependent alcohol dehydrogenase family protein [Sphingomonas sp. Leaf33]KQN25237.1 alcohol dehydrogenase [Sphingomonas sp. Leaf33]
MQITAAVLRTREAPRPYADSRPLRIETLELQPPGRDEVLVRIAAAGLCHSDLSVINGQRPRPLPMALGHEAAGVVEGIGPGITDLAPGDHVVMVFVPSCGHCVPCAGGRPALCEPGAQANGAGTLLAGDIRLADDCGTAIHHHLGCSAFASHAVVSRRSLVKIDRDLPLHEAALFGCAVLTGVGAVVNTAEVRAGQSVAVIGLGGVGLAAVLGALAAGAAQVIAVDLDADKLALAQRLGATATVQAGPDAVAEVRALTGGGCDIVLEMAGAFRALESAVAMTARGGTTVTAGLPPPDAVLPVNIVSLVAEERTLKGSYIGTCVPTRDIPRFIALYRAGRLPVDRLVSGYLTLEEINAGFDALDAGKAVRQIIRF